MSHHSQAITNPGPDAPQTRDKLTLLATGTGGIEELQKTLPDNDAYFAFVREEKAFCLINFFPAGIPGVRRGRCYFLW